MKSHLLFRLTLILIMGSATFLPTTKTHSQNPVAGSASDIAWSPDGSVLAVSGNFGIAFYDADFQLDQVIATAATGELAWSPNGDWLAVGSLVADAYNFTLWDAHTRELVAAIDMPFYVTGLAWSPDSQRLAVATVEDGIFIYTIDPQNDAPNLIWTLTDTYFVLDMAWSPDGTSLAAADDGDDAPARVYVWNMATASLEFIADLATMAQISYISALAWSPDSTQIALGVGRSDGTVLPILEVASQTISAGYVGAVDELSFMGWSPDGTKFALTNRGSTASTLTLWEADSFSSLWVQPAPDQGGYFRGGWKPDSTQLALVALDAQGAVSIVAVETGTKITTLALPAVTPIAPTPNP